MEYVVIGITHTMQEALLMCQDRPKKYPQLTKSKKEPKILYVAKTKEPPHSAGTSTNTRHLTVDYSHLTELILSRISKMESEKPHTPKPKFQGHIYVKKQKKIFRVSLNNVLHIYVEGRYSILVSEHGKYLLQMSLAKLIRQFPDIFIRCHRNYLVHFDKISCIDLNDFQVNLSNGDYVPLSIRYKDKLLKRLRLLK